MLAGRRRLNSLSANWIDYIATKRQTSLYGHLYVPMLNLLHPSVGVTLFVSHFFVPPDANRDVLPDMLRLDLRFISLKPGGMSGVLVSTMSISTTLCHQPNRHFPY